MAFFEEECEKQMEEFIHWCKKQKASGHTEGLHGYGMAGLTALKTSHPRGSAPEAMSRGHIR